MKKTLCYLAGPMRSSVLIALAKLEAQEKEAKHAAAGKLAHEKEKPLRSERYRRLVAARRCKHCGRAGRSQAAHPPPTGKSIKQDDRLCFPLCADGPGEIGCHSRFDQYKLMPAAKARAQALKWARETRAEIEAEGFWPKNLPKWK